MGAVVEEKEDVSKGESSSSVVDNGTDTSATATTDAISASVAGHDNTIELKSTTSNALPKPIAAKRPDTSGLTTLQPASKRIKLETADTTNIDASNNTTVGTVTAKNVSDSSNVIAKTPTPIAPKDSNQLQHSIAPSISKEQPLHPNGQASTPTPNFSVESTDANRNIPVKVETSSSSSSSSVVTASRQSSPQHTSHSSNTSADSSNGSLHESDTNPTITTSTPPTTSKSNVPGANKGLAQTVSTTSPPVQGSNATVVTQTDRSQVVTQTASTRIIQPSSKPITGGPPVSPPPLAPSMTTSRPNTSTNATASNKEVPLKSLNFEHLRIKYLGELEYMLREFRKLERQLLGAKGAQQLEESVGSRERREKLHSFILHLEDTIRQIEIGCDQAISGGNGSNSTATNNTSDAAAAAAAKEAKKQMAQESALSNLTKEKEEEETVQKLEEHILANLLPVKVRLKKQLAAQQGATQNPPGMPAMRRGTLQPSSTTRGKGTFVEAAEKKRKHAESLRLAAQAQHERQVRSVTDPTQFGKPLSGVGSSLTKKLHGSTLGSKNRRTGHGVGSISSKDTQERKILHAGMVPKSTQQKSGLSAASGAHEMIQSSSQNDKANSKPATAALAASLGGKSTPTQPLQIKPKLEPKTSGIATAIVVESAGQKKSIASGSRAPLSEEDKLKFKKHRRLRKLKRLKRRRERELARQQLAKSQQLPNNSLSTTSAGRKKAGHSKVGQKKKGPRVVEYICSQCSEPYSSTCDYNPWWALAQHKCPKCGKNQIPRIDITSPANAIEYHPALLSHLEDGGRGGGGSIAANTAQAIAPSMPIVSQISDGANSINSESDSDLSELSDDNISIGSLRAAELESELQSMTPAERAEHETFGKEYEGPVLPDEHAAKLLILMGHASTCLCQHKSEKLKDVCRSTKYMMLHVRDCPGTTSTFDVCPFPWCRKVKHLLYHLVSCTEPDQCAICSPKELPKGYKQLLGLNAHRMKKYRERLVTVAKASLAAKNSKLNQATKKQTSTKKTASVSQATANRKVTSDTKAPAIQQNSVNQNPAPPQATVLAPAKPESNTQTLAPAPYISSIDTEGSSSDPVANHMVTQMHPAMTQPLVQANVATTELEDFDINAEIAKLDEQLGSDVLDASQTCTIVPMKLEPGTETTTTAPNEQVLPTPVAAIKLEDHNVDDAELSDLLASNSPSNQKSVANPMSEGDVGDVSEYLENEYKIPQQQPQDAVKVTEHQQQIDRESGVPGVETLNDPVSDPLANVDHEILMEAPDVPDTTLVPAATATAAAAAAANTIVVKQEYPEALNAASAQPTSDVPNVTATTPEVEKSVGSVKVK